MKLEINGLVTSDEINALMHLCWDKHQTMNFDSILEHNLAHCIVRDCNGKLIAYCNLAWDGGRHATIFDLNVHPDYRHQGLALKMITELKNIAKANNVQFLHVDFDDSLAPLYQKAGFEMISAGLIQL